MGDASSSYLSKQVNKTSELLKSPKKRNVAFPFLFVRQFLCAFTELLNITTVLPLTKRASPIVDHYNSFCYWSRGEFYSRLACARDLAAHLQGRGKAYSAVKLLTWNISDCD